VVPRRDDDAALRRFALRGAPEGGRCALAEGEAEHARRVLRLGVGDRLWGLDGAGGAWPLVVARSDARAFEVEVDGAPRREPAPGEAGATLPWIEVCAALPRGERAEALVDRLVQLGAAVLRPLRAARASPEARGEGARRTDRLERAARGAAVQSGRLWALRIEAGAAPASVLVQPALLDVRFEPGAAESALPALLALDLAGTRARPVRLWIGPEGGFDPAEVAQLDAAGARALRLGPHVLRIETAAEAGLALVAAASRAR
jgi:16S rRNA (uracil1498-N3)-methyltransferase